MSNCQENKFILMENIIQAQCASNNEPCDSHITRLLPTWDEIHELAVNTFVEGVQAFIVHL